MTLRFFRCRYDELRRLVLRVSSSLVITQNGISGQFRSSICKPTGLALCPGRSSRGENLFARTWVPLWASYVSTARGSRLQDRTTKERTVRSFSVPREWRALRRAADRQRRKQRHRETH